MCALGDPAGRKMLETVVNMCALVDPCRSASAISKEVPNFWKFGAVQVGNSRLARYEQTLRNQHRRKARSRAEVIVDALDISRVLCNTVQNNS